MDGSADLELSNFARALEDGDVLYFPMLAFHMSEEEKGFLSPSWTDGRAKNISYDDKRDSLRGAQGDAADLKKLKAMLGRYRRQATSLITTLFPHYQRALRAGRTSFRPVRVEDREMSWRKDDSRLHVDAFPSQPTQGERILSVFTNLNPAEEPRVWRIGERFDGLVERLGPRLRRPCRGVRPFCRRWRSRSRAAASMTIICFNCMTR